MSQLPMLTPLLNHFKAYNGKVTSVAQRLKYLRENNLYNAINGESTNRTVDLNEEHLQEIVSACLQFKSKISKEHPIICIGRSPRWIAEGLSQLAYNTIIFNYSGSAYLDLIQTRQKGINLLSLSKKDIFEMRTYLVAKNFHPHNIFTPEGELIILDYIESGISLLAFLYFITHWQYDLMNQQLSDPTQWMQNPLSQKTVDELIKKLKLIVMGCNDFDDVAMQKVIEPYTSQLKLMKEQISFRILDNTILATTIALNEDHGLGLKLSPHYWHEATNWLIFEQEQYQDKYALLIRDKLFVCLAEKVDSKIKVGI